MADEGGFIEDVSASSVLKRYRPYDSMNRVQSRSFSQVFRQANEAIHAASRIR